VGLFVVHTRRRISAEPQRSPGFITGFDRIARMTKEDYFEQAVNAFGDDKLDDAIEMYKRALELDPNYQDALHGLGMAFHNRGRIEEAIVTAKRLVEIDPDDILAHTSLSMFYQAQGKIDEAEKEGNVARILGWKQELRKDGK
jgi:tetratricopeptide (TPR) repeat protein